MKWRRIAVIIASAITLLLFGALLAENVLLKGQTELLKVQNQLLVNSAEEAWKVAEAELELVDRALNLVGTICERLGLENPARPGRIFVPLMDRSAQGVGGQ